MAHVTAQSPERSQLWIPRAEMLDGAAAGRRAVSGTLPLVQSTFLFGNYFLDCTGHAPIQAQFIYDNPDQQLGAEKVSVDAPVETPERCPSFVIS